MHRTIRSTLLLSALCIGAGASAESSAQTRTAPPVPLGSRIRVEIGPEDSSRTLIGRLTEWGSDTIALGVPGGAALRIATGAVTRVDVSRGKGVVASHVLVGAGIGFVAGALVGGAVGSSGSSESWIAPLQTVGGMITGALVGGAGGAIVGMAVPGEKWRRVSLERPAVSVVPRRRGVAVLCTLRL